MVLKSDDSILVSTKIVIAWIAFVTSIFKRTYFWRWWTIIFMARVWSYMEPILWRCNRTFTNWTVLMITFMITYEVRMNCQVTLFALVFFQNCSKCNTIPHNKDVLLFRFSVNPKYLLTYEDYRYLRLSRYLKWRSNW